MKQHLTALVTFSCAALACALAGAGTARAQGPEALPTVRRAVLAPGRYFDLDSGASLPGRKLDRLQADLRFDRDGVGFFVDPMLVGQPGGGAAADPDDEAWRAERIRLTRGDVEDLKTVYVRTDHGIARVTITVVDPYSVASANLEWVVVPNHAAVFLPPPSDVALERDGNRVRASWSGDTARYLVELTVGDAAPQKELVDGRSHAFDVGGPDTIAADTPVRVEVRAFEDGALSTPASAVRFGADRSPLRGHVDYADEWYRTTGGLSLVHGRAEHETADVVFYLYGVYVPGGGVQKLGNGYRTFASLTRLPDDGYLPSYGRLDEHDVLAIRLPDGRRGAVWLVPADGSDVRSGMRVHTVFAADGRHHLVCMPDVQVETEARRAKLSWQPVEQAQSYAIVVPGRNPLMTRDCSCELNDLPKNRLHQVQVFARDEFGTRSLPATVSVSTFGEGATLRRLVLPGQRRGVELATGDLVAGGDLKMAGSAGGAQVVWFEAPHGFAALGEREFGDFENLPPRVATGRLTVEKRGSERFFVWTADGGCAAVHVLAREPSEVEIEYVWLPPEMLPAKRR